jgi:hypothetical protein
MHKSQGRLFFQKTIDPSLQIFFMHIPKCAGTALKDIVSKILGHQNVYHITPEIIKKNVLDESIRHRFVWGHFPYRFLQQMQTPITRVSFLRDPVDRVISLYYYWRSSDLDQVGPKLAKELSLLDFLGSKNRAVRMQVENIQAWHFIDHYAPVFRNKYMTREADPSYDDLLDVAKAHLDEFEYVGLTEHFDQSVKDICEVYGWPVPKSVPRVNKTVGRPRVSMISDTERERILELNKVDVGLYEYVKAKSSLQNAC